MSYSYTITEDPSEPAELHARISAAIEALPDGPGKEEAKTHSPIAAQLLDVLAHDVLPAEQWTASVSGHGGGDHVQFGVAFTKTSAEQPDEVKT